MTRRTSAAKASDRNGGPNQGRRSPGSRPSGGPERRSWLWRHRRALFFLWLFIFFGIAGAAFLLSRIPLPPASVQTQTTFINDANGRQLAAIKTGQNRVAVHLVRVPQVAMDAVLSSEDRNYYHHGGIDPIGLVRALTSDVRGSGSLQGGSTITQQYVKQAYLSPQRTLLRKIKEAALAVRLQRKLSKNQILERYLNTIYWGRGAWGIQAASQAYFRENVEQLTLPQAALLAGLIRGPEVADPTRAPSIALGRRSETIKSLVRDHKISQTVADQANAAPLDAVSPDQSQEFSVADAVHGTQFFVNYVEQQLQQRYPLGVGLRVTTTIDLTLQDQAYNAIYGRPLGLRADEPAGAAVAVDNNGQVKAMVGGADYTTSQVNLAVGRAGGGSGRQPGSTFKPFLLAETIKEGYSVRSTFPAPPMILIKGQGDKGADYQVNNFKGEDGGTTASLIDATAQSLNTVYAQLEMAIGPKKLVQMAQQLGLDPNDVGLSPNASLVLGTPQVSVLEMAAAYATFARGGTFIAPQVITKVTTADGTPLPWQNPAPRQILTPAQNSELDYCLQQVVQRGTGTGADFGIPIAGKTGTTSDYTDAWFIGYTPKLTAAVWMGYTGGTKPMIDVRGIAGGLQGGQLPAALWRRFMSTATANGAYGGDFPTVTSFPGSLVGLPSGISYPSGTGTASNSMVPKTQGSTIPVTSAAPSATTPPFGRTTTTGSSPILGTLPRSTTSIKPITSTSTATKKP